MKGSARENNQSTAVPRNYLQESGTIYKWYDKLCHKFLRGERISRIFGNDARVSGPRLRAENPDQAA